MIYSDFMGCGRQEISHAKADHREVGVRFCRRKRLETDCFLNGRREEKRIEEFIFRVFASSREFEIFGL
jgi:hypothetical protein